MPVAYATDSSKAVVPVWFLVHVALCFLLRGAFHVDSCLNLCPRVFLFVCFFSVFVVVVVVVVFVLFCFFVFLFFVCLFVFFVVVFQV